ncbi:DUF4124 domain-containing protein [Rhodoferax sp.]|uniref:DUF4124 domain-containing protein n=1 Tax=Rhodoferax sp. TaxID=50421 RepID=UPI002636A18B|nr:DUF4124 domain-containing protein [Rhodoferax sp.]MDD2926365.1 DUF4124 domain-containing protein [Rhodoferax sp.]
MTHRHQSLMAGVLASLVTVWATAQTPPPAAEIYTCTDAKGRKLTSDRPIMECRDREQTILNPSGTVKSRIGPTLTAQELSQLEAQKKAEQAEKDRLKEEKRRDQALLIRYPNQAVHQKERAEALAHIDHVKQTASTRVADLQRDLATLSDEMAFYKKDPQKAPIKLRRQMEEINQALAAQERFIAEQDAEAARVNSRFDAEWVRLTPLWRMAATTPQ